MKILYVSAALLDAHSGDTEHVLCVARHMAAQGEQVHLIATTRGAHASGPEAATGLRLHLVDRRGRSTLRLLQAVAREAHRVAAQLAPDIVYVRPFPLDWPLLLRGLHGAGRPYVCELNTMIADEYRANGQPLRGWVYERLYARSIRHARDVLPVTPEIGRWAQRVAAIAPPRFIAGNGVEIEPFDAAAAAAERAAVREREGVPPEASVFVMAGFSAPWHGFDRAIGMMAHLDSRTRLWLIGAEGEDVAARAQALAAAHGVSGRVRVFPRLGRAEVSALLSACDVGLGPLALDRKKMAEAQPIKVRLYLARGLPILYNYLDPRLDPHLPFLSQVDAVDPAALAAAAGKLRGLGAEGHQAARDFARKHLAWSVIAAETRAHLAGLVASAPR